MSDALVALPFGQHPQDFNLARREGLGQAGRPGIDQEPVQVIRLQDDETGGCSFNRCHDLRCARMPGQYGPDAGPQCFSYAGQAWVIGHQNPGSFRHAIGDFNGNFVAILPFGKDDARVFSGVFSPVGHAPDYLDGANPAQKRFEPGASHRRRRQHKHTRHAASALPASNRTTTSLTRR